eukprot:753285-Hanusia_phi.AAC.2
MPQQAEEKMGRGWRGGDFGEGGREQQGTEACKRMNLFEPSSDVKRLTPSLRGRLCARLREVGDENTHEREYLKEKK